MPQQTHVDARSAFEVESESLKILKEFETDVSRSDEFDKQFERKICDHNPSYASAAFVQKFPSKFSLAGCLQPRGTAAKVQGLRLTRPRSPTKEIAILDIKSDVPVNSKLKQAINPKLQILFMNLFITMCISSISIIVSAMGCFCKPWNVFIYVYIYIYMPTYIGLHRAI